MAQNNQDEIDLGYLFNKISDIFRYFIRLLFLVIAFFIKYIIVIVVLIIVGIGIGYYFDRTSKTIYKSEMIVIPNFESTDYLYEEVEALNIKRKANDSLFFKSFLDGQHQNFLKIEIEPIIDVYTFMAEKKENIETLKILYNEKDLDEFLKDNSLSKNYKYHKIIITSKGEESEKISNSILEYINNNKHFKSYQSVGIEDTKIQISQNKEMISQVDSILKSVSNETSQKQLQSVSINSQSELYQMINVKQALLNNRLELQKKLIDQDQIVKLVSGNYGLQEEGLFSISNKVKIPLIFVIIFSSFFFLSGLYKKMKHIAETDAA